MKKHIYLIVTFIVVCLISILAWWNYSAVNKNSQIIIENLFLNFEETKSSVEKIQETIDSTSHSCIQEEKIKEASKELSSLLSDIDKSKHEVTMQQQALFDANTVTFLISFLSALLFTGFISLFIKSSEQYEKIERKINELFKDKYTALNSLYKTYTALSQIFNGVSVLGANLASSEYNIQQGYHTLVYMIEREIRQLREERFNGIKAITPEDKKRFLEIITDCIAYLNMEELKANNTMGLKAFEDLNNDLLGIQEMIENIPIKRSKL